MSVLYYQEFALDTPTNMKLKPEFQIYEALGERYLVPLGDAPFKGIVKGNETAAFIWRCLEKGTTEEEIIKGLLAEYAGVTETEAAKDVSAVLERLRSIGAIEE